MPRPRADPATHMRLISVGSASWNFNAPQPMGCARRVASRNRPCGGRSSSALAGMLIVGSKPVSKRRSSSAKYSRRQYSAWGCCGSIVVISIVPPGNTWSVTADRDAAGLARTQSQGERALSPGAGRLFRQADREAVDQLGFLLVEVLG